MQLLSLRVAIQAQRPVCMAVSMRKVSVECQEADSQTGKAMRHRTSSVDGSGLCRAEAGCRVRMQLSAENARLVTGYAKSETDEARAFPAFPHHPSAVELHKLSRLNKSPNFSLQGWKTDVWGPEQRLRGQI